MGKVIIKTKNPKEPLGDLFGLFFEDINHAADGGLYGELVRNRSFEFSPIDNHTYHGMTAWEIADEKLITAELLDSGAVSEKNPHNLKITVKKAGAKAALINQGFGSGIPVEAGKEYAFSCYARTDSETGMEIRVELTDAHGSQIYREKRFRVTGAEWKQYTLTLDSENTDYSGRLRITFPENGTVYFDLISLFPKDTFRNRENGLRADLAQLLADMKPRFLRFPGGCLIHDGELDPDARNSMYRWKNTIGPLPERAARRNNWGYNQTAGLGYYEYFQFCEDIGAKPLPVLPAAYDPHHQRMVPLDKLQPWIDDALDLIEFANGGTDTKWGAVRSRLGHPEPFGLEYIGIGNEEIGEGFVERYPYFHKAIREKYPEIRIIGTASPFAAGSEYERGWKCARKYHSDLIDEHYYQNPEWFLGNMHRYDDFSAEDPKVFLGEYASCGNTWYNALVESAYMTQLQNDAHAVKLACYAPLFCHADYVNWRPDMIWFNNHTYFLTPNYHVQKLFMNHQGDMLLERKLVDLGENQVTEPDTSGEILGVVFGGSVKYSNIQVTNHEDNSTVSVADIQLKGDIAAEPILSLASTHYTLTLDAEQLEGMRGFYISFGQKSPTYKFAWELGGWQNLDSQINDDRNGRVSCLTESKYSIETGRVYHLKLVVDGAHIQSYVDGELINDVTVQPVVIEPLYVTASAENETGDIIVKVVNLQNEDVTTELDLSDRRKKLSQGEIYFMGGYPMNAENSFAAPNRVEPKEGKISVTGNRFTYTFPKESLTILRLR